MTPEKRSESAARNRLTQAGVQRLRYPLEVYDSAQQLYNLKPRPTWTWMELELRRMHPDGSPSEGALRLWEKRGIITEAEDDAPWEFGSKEFSPEDDSLVMEVNALSYRGRAAAARGYEYQPAEYPPVVLPPGAYQQPVPWFHISWRMARTIVRVRRAYPDIPIGRPFFGWVVQGLTHGGDDAFDAQVALCLTPWREGAKEWVQRIIDAGLLTERQARLVRWDEFMMGSDDDAKQ